jgi:formylglycine-generating enzyme required for sulfatase activity
MPKGETNSIFRVLRGGSYLKKYGVRVAERDKFIPTDKLADVGFRVVYFPL